MIKYKPKVRNIYNQLVNEYIDKVSTESTKVPSYAGRCVIKNSNECTVRIISPRNIAASRRNRNYYASVIIHHYEERK